MKITFEGTFEEVIDHCTKLYASVGDGKAFLPPLELSHTWVMSDKGPGTEYKITKIGQLAVACTCPDFIHRNSRCKHIRRINGS